MVATRVEFDPPSLRQLAREMRLCLDAATRVEFDPPSLRQMLLILHNRIVEQRGSNSTLPH